MSAPLGTLPAVTVYGPIPVRLRRRAEERNHEDCRHHPHRQHRVTGRAAASAGGCPAHAASSTSRPAGLTRARTADVVQTDLADSDAVVRATRGADALFWLAPFNADRDADPVAWYALARHRAGITDERMPHRSSSVGAWRSGTRAGELELSPVKPPRRPVDRHLIPRSVPPAAAVLRNLAMPLVRLRRGVTPPDARRQRLPAQPEKHQLVIASVIWVDPSGDVSSTGRSVSTRHGRMLSGAQSRLSSIRYRNAISRSSLIRGAGDLADARGPSGARPTRSALEQHPTPRSCP